MPQSSFFTFLRKLILVIVLICVALGSWLARNRATNWEDALWVTVYPINGDNSERSANYIAAIDPKTFVDIEAFMLEEAQHFELKLDPVVHVDIGNPVTGLPPVRPKSAGLLNTIYWSLQLRWWAYQATRNQPGPTPDIRMFLIYFDPNSSEVLPHSLGLQEGLFGIANIFSSPRMQGSNNVVITHEILHTLGATDKYSGPDYLPTFPAGYAEPERAPLYPQRYAEIMGGRIPLSKQNAAVPDSLAEVLVGELTAREINWQK